MALVVGGGRVACSAWPRLSCAVHSQFGRGPSPLKPFVAAGCSFLVPSFNPFTLSPDRKPPVPVSPPQSGLRNRRTPQGMLQQGSWRKGVLWGIRKPTCKRTGLPPFT